MQACVRGSGGSRCRQPMLPRGCTGRDYTSLCFHSAGFLPFAVLLSVTKPPSLSILLSLLLPGKRSSGGFNSSSTLWDSSLQLRLTGLHHLRWMTSGRNARWMYRRGSYVLGRLRVLDRLPATCRLMRAAVCRMFAMCGGVLGGLRVGRLFGLLFFTACGTHKREATDQNNKKSHVLGCCLFCFPSRKDKMICPRFMTSSEIFVG